MYSKIQPSKIYKLYSHCLFGVCHFKNDNYNNANYIIMQIILQYSIFIFRGYILRLSVEDWNCASFQILRVLCFFILCIHINDSLANKHNKRLAVIITTICYNKRYMTLVFAKLMRLFPNCFSLFNLFLCLLVMVFCDVQPACQGVWST